jgi:methylglyoxal synthase
VRALKTSKEIWDKLKATYHQIDVATQVTSYTKLIEIPMAENANVIEFLDEFQCLVDDATIADLDIRKPQLIILLLKALPSS